MIKGLLLPISIVFILVFSGCDKKEVCKRCAAHVESTFNGHYFKILLNANFEPTLFYYDSINKTSNSYDLCSNDIIGDIELNKIIEASGNIRKLCENSSIELVEIAEFKVIETCIPKITKTNVEYTLFNNWLMHYIETPDTLVFPPCEGYSNVNFTNQAQKVIAGNISANWFEGNYILLNDSTIKMPETLAQSLSIGTSSQTYFESLFQKVFTPNALITYSIDNNFLLLKNKEKKSFIKLYQMPNGG